MGMALRVVKNGFAMRQIISEEKRRQIVAALKENPNATQVARKIGGVSNTTVGKIAKAAGIALAAAKSRKRLSAEQRAQIIAALKENPNATQLAREVGGVNYRTVVRLAERAGIELTAGKAARGHPRVSSEKQAQIIAALKDNPNATQIAREVGCVNYRTVVRLAEGAGIELTAGKAARGHPRVSPEKHAQIIAALKDNPNAAAVAKQIGGVSHTKVGKIAKAAGIALAAAESGKRISTKQRAQIIGALKINPNAAAVATQIGGVSQVAVWKIAKAAGIELTRGKAARDHRPNELST